MAVVIRPGTSRTQVILKSIGYFIALGSLALLGFTFLFAIGKPDAQYSAGMMMGAGTVAIFIVLPGLLIYYGGFSWYKQYRLLADTPRASIHSLPMGLVEIEGQAGADKMVIAPVTHIECCAYKLRVDRDDNQRQPIGTLITMANVEDGNFYIKDATGQVRIDMRGIELDAITPYLRMVSMDSRPTFTIDLSGSPPGPGMAGDDELRAFIRKLVPNFPAPRAQLYEYHIVTGPIYSVTGTCAENPHATGEADRKIIRKGENDPEFRIACRTREEEIQKLRHRAQITVPLGAAVAILGMLMSSVFVLFAVIGPTNRTIVRGSQNRISNPTRQFDALGACKQAVNRFHTMFQAGQDDAIYDAADPMYRAAVSREAHNQLFSIIRQNVGSFTSTQFRSSEAAPEATTEGTALRLHYLSQFARRKMLENFTFKIGGQSPLLLEYTTEFPQDQRSTRNF